MGREFGEEWIHVHVCLSSFAIHLKLSVAWFIGYTPIQSGCLLSHVWFLPSLWTEDCQAFLSVGFFRGEHWSGLPFPPPGDLPYPGIESKSPVFSTLLADSLPTEILGKPVSAVQFSSSVMSDSLQPHGLQHARPPCPSPTPRVYSNACPSSWWCHPTISSSIVPFSSHLQSFPASGSFWMSQFFTSGGQSIGKLILQYKIKSQKRRDEIGFALKILQCRKETDNWHH